MIAVEPHAASDQCRLSISTIGSQLPQVSWYGRASQPARCGSSEGDPFLARILQREDLFFRRMPWDPS
jgi:hypothetical protein